MLAFFIQFKEPWEALQETTWGQIKETTETHQATWDQIKGVQALYRVIFISDPILEPLL